MWVAPSADHAGEKRKGRNLHYEDSNERRQQLSQKSKFSRWI